jgi:polysaccharide chain length determinant protein (PEP-CTERM system associated)
MIDTTKFTQVLIFKRHWPLSVITAMTVIAVIIPTALGMPPLYRAGARLSVERQAPANQTQAQILTAMETRLLLIKNETLSRSYLENVIERLNLYPELRQNKGMEIAIDRVQRDISIQPNQTLGGNSGQTTLTFTISFIAEDPEKAAEVANALAKFYIAQNDLIRNREVGANAEQLENQMKEAKRALDEANGNLIQYTKAHANELPEQASFKSLQLSGVIGDLGAKSARLAALKSQQNAYDVQIVAELNKPVPAVTSASSTPEQMLAAAQRDLQGFLDKKAGESNREVIRLRALIGALESQLSSARPGPKPAEPVLTSQLDVFQRQLKETRAEIATLIPEITNLESERGRLLNELRAIPMRNPVLDDLTKTADNQRQLYDGFKRLYDQAFIAAELEKSHTSQEFRILDEAMVPLDAAGPNRAGLILAGFIGALVLGVGVAVLRDQLDTSFHTLDELRGFTQVPVLASIPLIVTNKHRVRHAAILVVGTCVLLVSLAFVSVGIYEYAQRHTGLTRLVTK